jgi:hypothetical protein
MAKEYTELQLEAKEAGIKRWHVKLETTLIKELADIAEAVVEAVEPVLEAVEAIEEVVEEVVDVVDPMKLMRLLNGRTWNKAMMSLKGRAQKSDLWEYRDFITVEYERELKEAKALKDAK